MALVVLAAPLAVRAAAEAPVAAEVPGAINPLTPLGPGDTVTLHVFGQPDMDSQLSVASDGTIRVPLAGRVQVGGLSVGSAARRVESALKNGGYLVSPHVTLTLAQSVSQRVAVLGQVRNPGLYPIDSQTSIFDLLARAGGITDLGSDTRIYVLRTGAQGKVERYAVSLGGLSSRADPGEAAVPTVQLRAGDSVFVPRAREFYIMGQVQKPGSYRIEPDLTILKAISMAGGLTPKGTTRRVEIIRTEADGKQVTLGARPSDFVHANDQVVVKESIF